MKQRGRTMFCLLTSLDGCQGNMCYLPHINKTVSPKRNKMISPQRTEELSPLKEIRFSNPIETRVIFSRKEEQLSQRKKIISSFSSLKK